MVVTEIPDFAIISLCQSLWQLQSVVEIDTNFYIPGSAFRTLGVQIEKRDGVPYIASLEVPLDFVTSDDVIFRFNNLNNLREFTINGDVVGDRNAIQSDAFLEKLLLKNLEKVAFLRCPEFNNRIQFYDRLTRNHPKIKEFTIETDDFGMGAVRVIVRNLENLEKFVVETEDSKFEWDLEKLNDFRKICDC